MTQNSVFETFPTLRTERCMLNYIENSDIISVGTLLKDKNVIRYIEAIESPLSLDETKDFISLFQASYHNRRAILWAIRVNAVPEVLVGLIAIYQIEGQVSTELLYLLSPQYWNQGYMNECLRCVTQFSFDHMMIEIVRLSINKENQASIILAEKCGYIMKKVIGNEVIFEKTANNDSCS